MFAVGIDVSNGRSTVAALRTKTDIVMKPFNITHNLDGLSNLVKQLQPLGDDVKIVMEHTGRYYESLALFLHNAGFFVCAVNPLIIKSYNNGDNPLRRIKTDNADSVKIAQYAIDNWATLRAYIPVDTIRYELKTLNRQFLLASKNRTACSNNLVALLEQTYPGLRSHFESPVREDGSQKWVDYAKTFWHLDCVRKQSESAFVERYRKWCSRHGYNFSEAKAKSLYEDAKQRICLVPKSETSKLLIVEAVNQLNAISRTMEVFRAQMQRLAEQLPEYETVMGIYGVGKSLGPQLIAEIGDVSRFAHQKSLVAFAGVDPGKNESGDMHSRSVKTSKRGSPELRRTLFVIMTVLMQLQPADDPVYQFLDKKRSEGKPYHVYMTAGGTKFLRIYYGKVRDCLKAKGLWNQENPTPSNPV
jgi:Transposase and inactivated derivatives